MGLVKEQALAIGRMLLVAVVTSAVIIGGLALVYSGANARTEQVANDTLHATLATACVLSLPVTSTGRDPVLVQLCFTQYHLTPPILHNP